MVTRLIQPIDESLYKYKSGDESENIFGPLRIFGIIPGYALKNSLWLVIMATLYIWDGIVIAWGWIEK
jgi:hypothetical protein